MASRKTGAPCNYDRGRGHPRRDLTFTEALKNLEPEPEEDDYEPVLMHWVYFVLDPDSCQIKIGTTNSVKRRMAELRAKRPNIELLGSARAGYKYERMLHRRFEPYRREGEWFSSEIVAELPPLIDL